MDYMGTWGIELWDKREVIELHTHNGLDFLDKSAAFMKERIRVEQEYAKSLRRLVKQFQYKKKEDLPFTYQSAFKRFLDENDEFASQREMIAEEMNTKILKEMVTLSTTSKGDRKKALQKLTTYKDELQQQHKGLLATKKKFDQSSEEANVALKAHENACHSLDYTKQQITKLQKASVEKGMQVEKARDGYKTALDSYNGKQTLYYEVEVAGHIRNEIQGPEEKRIENLSVFLLEYAAIQHRSTTSALKSFEGMIDAAKSCNPAKDSLTLIDQHKSGIVHPGDLPFEEYVANKTGSLQRPTRRKPSKTMSNQNTEISSFSNLPPDQRRKKITDTIVTLEKQLSELEKSNLGIRGDRSSDTPDTEEIERVKQMIHQYQSFLTDIGDEGADDRTSKKNGSISSKINMQLPPPLEVPDVHDPTEVLQPIQTCNWDEFVEHCEVLYDFVARQEGEMSINAGEQLVIVEEDDGSGWTKVAGRGLEGYVPTSYITLN